MWRSVLIWGVVASGLAFPIAAAALSPLLAWREPVYIIAGFAGIVGLALLLMQPLLAMGYLPGLDQRRGRRVHRFLGAALVLMVIVHVAGLWLTSPPDVVDALLFVSPTPFSVWGVIAMWIVFAVAALAVMRRPLRLSPRIWRRLHLGAAAVIVTTTILHAVLIEGTMEQVSKYGLSVLVATATLAAVLGVRRR
ncbi:ferric reductase-like transmembrane domain-containing protein [uncultured Roseobacter sp.]|uniref:ferric reductase-like transmembrane domain-containing protein n=1 Tax=uncultured Roseobacter sp. TaxID=114847 RepID=UPI00260B079E|nr:ferric reductase-like transmembrane domain-containing protein [uncultured Roseobacter sp.]